MISPNNGRHYDVAVVGSGPAGSGAALSLANKGVRAVVIERESLPRYKTCGGGLARRAIDALPISVQPVVEREFPCAEINLLDAGLYFTPRRHEPIVSMTMRDKLDFLLVRVAQERGAEILTSCSVDDVSCRSDGVELTTSKGKLFAQFVIAADGASSLVARRVGWKPHLRLAPALEYEISVSHKLQDKLSQSLRFDFGVIPFGYGWVFPKQAHLSIGIGILRPDSGPCALKTAFQQYLSLLGINQAKRVERHGFVIPVSPRRGPLVRKRVLLVGDAAGFADPVTGEGITNAILSGRAAADAVIEGEFRDDLVQQKYHSAIETTILRELRAARLLASLLYGFPNFRSLAFRQYGRKLSEIVTDVLMGEKTFRKEICDLTNYFKLLTPTLQPT